MSPAEIHELTVDAIRVAEFRLSPRRAREMGLDEPSFVTINRLKGGDLAALLTWPGAGSVELLGVSDSLEEMVKGCSDLAAREVEDSPDGNPVLVGVSVLKARIAGLSVTDEPLELTPYQVLCATTYGQGEFAHVVDIAARSGRQFDRELAGCGDPLFRFLMRELDRREDCEDESEAIERLDRAMSDVLEVRNAVENGYAPSPR